MRRSVPILFAALATVSFGFCSTSVWAQAPLPDSGSSLSQAGGRTFHRPVTHMLGLASEQPWRVGAMKMVAPGIGWVLAAGGRLLWTENGGADWKNITPHFAGNENIGRIFFLDRSRGWVAHSLYEPDSDELQLTLASTTDAGANWSEVASTLRLNDYGISKGDAAGGGAAALAFTDALHGWVYVEFSGQTMNTRWSFLLVTSNGGQSWKRASHAPEMQQPEMLLVNPREGWLYGGGADDDGLYVSRDSARSWQKISPELAGLEQTEPRGLPTLEDAKHGFLRVNGVPRTPYEFRKTIVLMATSDGGKSWKRDRALTNVDEEWRDRYRSATVAGSEWIFASVLEHHPVLTKVGAGETIDASKEATASDRRYGEPRDLSFATSTQGWVVVGDGDLLSTTDGGATWTDITPGPKRKVVQDNGSGN
jgi:photosystem II stability/assembly factor-like uncharacterized protein